MVKKIGTGSCWRPCITPSTHAVTQAAELPPYVQASQPDSVMDSMMGASEPRAMGTKELTCVRDHVLDCSSLWHSEWQDALMEQEGDA